MGALIHLLTSPAATQQTLLMLLSFLHAPIALTRAALTWAGLVPVLRFMLSVVVLACAAAAAGGAWALGTAQSVVVGAVHGPQAGLVGALRGAQAGPQKVGSDGKGGGDSDGCVRWHAWRDGSRQLRYLLEQVQPLRLLRQSPDPIQMHALGSNWAASPAQEAQSAQDAFPVVEGAGCLSTAKDECDTPQPLVRCRNPRQKKQMHGGSIEDEQQQGVQGPGEHSLPEQNYVQHGEQHTTRCNEQHLTPDKRGLLFMSRGVRQLHEEGAAGAKHLSLHVQRLL
eukprot:CAMPEP_0202388892 /NCGR_PEP_ID=MMETSP1127-20130417/80005_1 /ASSEMBLY_ACC=CAM_ASM_000462 /TAXON_ID=3047 /ORGANISM="Dunaliella tertiolecta, Strain CCMP1320" /LENGTH=281 /DNA_ID=CAMNT_0048990473 /DNA_START=33 /DNA_END=874 /DNA_ORIENTATION=+